MGTFGRKPGNPDLGWGQSYAGTQRASIMGKPAKNARLVQFGIRAGRNTGTTPTLRIGLYDTDSGGGVVNLKIGESSAISPAIYMADSWSGGDYLARPSSPLRMYPTKTYALAYITTGASMAHGQDNSGHTMHQRDGQPSFRNPFGSLNTRPEGKMSIWAELVDNRAPNKPGGLVPADESTVSDSTPTLTATFSDPDEILTGYANYIDEFLKKYRFEIYTSDGKTRLHDSGIINATSTQQGARSASWDVPTALGAARYQARCTMWDQFDVPSTTAIWEFSVNTGGAVTSATLDPGAVSGVTVDTTPIANAVWTHSGALNMTAKRARIIDSTGAVIRADDTVTGLNIAPGGTIAGWWPAAWAALSPNQKFQLVIEGQDSGGLWSAGSKTPLTTVNGFPNAPTDMLPPNGTATSLMPEISAVITDPNDATETLTAGFYVRLQGDTGNGLLVPSNRTSFSGGRHRTTLTATELPAKGIYEWRVVGVDPFSVVGVYSAWQSFTYADPPAITGITPASGSTLTTGTPTITATSSVALASFRIVYRDIADLIADHDSDVVATAGSSISYVTPAAKLRNNTTYDVEIEVTSTNGLVGTATTRITIAYIQPAAPTTVRSAPVAGPYEAADRPLEWSRIETAWDEVPVAQVPDEEWDGYVVRRTSMKTGKTLRIARLMARNATVFVDKTPITGETYRYDLSYLVRKNNLDTVESVIASSTATVNLRHTVVTTLDADDITFIMRFWDGRDATNVHDQDVIPTWGEKPIVFTGPTNYKIVSGTFKELDTDTYTALEMQDRVAEAAMYDLDENGDSVSRIVFYRDPKGRGFPAVITTNNESDHHMMQQVGINLAFTEVDADLEVE